MHETSPIYLMDPFTLTASILTVVGAGAQTIKLLEKAASLRNTPPLALALKDELSDLRLSVLAIEELFSEQSKELAISSSQDTVRHRNTVVSVIGYLERANSLIIKLDGVLDPLLKYLLRSDVAAPKKWFKWIKEEKRLQSFKDNLHRVRMGLNTALGILNL